MVICYALVIHSMVACINYPERRGRWVMSGKATDPCNKQIDSSEPQDNTQRYNTLTNLREAYGSLTHPGIELCFYSRDPLQKVKTAYCGRTNG